MTKEDRNKKENQKPGKPVLIYTFMAIMFLALIIVGTMTGFVLKKLVSLQTQVGDLEMIVSEVSQSSAALQQLNNLSADISTGSIYEQPIGPISASQPEQLSAKGQAEPEPEPQTSADAVNPENPNQQNQNMSIEDIDAQKNAAGNAEAENPPEEQSQSQGQGQLEEEGMISPPKGSPVLDDEQLDMLMQQVEVLLPDNNGSWSVYVCNLKQDSEQAINEHAMQAASLIKLYIMGAVYENYDALIQTYGQEQVDGQLLPMITVSDNDAANTLVNWLGRGDNQAGMAVVNDFCANHGYTNTSMGRMLLASKENGDNYTSVTDCGRFLREIYQINNNTCENPTLSHADSMYYLLKRQERRNKIPAKLPEGVQTANKTGELADVENDAGIIYDTAKGVDLVVCFMSENLSAVGSAQTCIAENTRRIYGYYNE